MSDVMTIEQKKAILIVKLDKLLDEQDLQVFATLVEEISDLQAEPVTEPAK